MPKYSALSLLFLCLVIGGCGNMRGPSLKSNPESMSSDTLCYRDAVKPMPEFRTEIKRRNLDCRSILENDPLLIDRRY